MKAADFNPHKLDVAAFAKAGASLSGQCPLTDLPRLLESVPEEARADLLHPLSWAVTGLLRPVAGGEPEVWLHLRAHADVPLSCQRCLQPMVEHLAIERQARFVADEATAAELDAVLEDDVLVLSRSFDLRWWLEDELILELPLMPLHQSCRPAVPLGQAAEPAAAEDERPHPFAALAALKKRSDRAS
ncbi:MAG: YceD family protein [Aquabacterium sp.]|nr:YceD family protein [Aquabacterium sp.]